jgi:hypothetical protein
MPTPDVDPQATASTLPVDLQQNLALLKDAPEGVAESTIALFGTEMMKTLAAADVIEMTEHTPRRITISPLGYSVIDTCVETAPPRVQEPLGPDSWTHNHRAKLDAAIKTLRES